MSRARTLAGAIGSDGALNVADVAGLAAVASSGSASDLSTGTLPNARLASGAAVANLGYTPSNKAGDTFTGQVAVNSSLTAWSLTTPGKSTGNLHFGASSATADAGAAITFAARDSGGAHAGIYINSDGGYGTKLTLATTDDYSIGSRGRLFIDHLGRVRMPAQPAFNVSYTSGGSVTGKVVFNQVFDNNGSHYSTSTGLFTAPVAGYYMFSGSFMNGAAGGGYFLWRFLKNQTTAVHNQWFQSWVGASGTFVSNDGMNAGSVVVYLSGGDTMNVEVSSTYANWYTGGYNAFCGHFIG